MVYYDNNIFIGMMNAIIERFAQDQRIGSVLQNRKRDIILHYFFSPSSSIDRAVTIQYVGSSAHRFRIVMVFVSSFPSTWNLIYDKSVIVKPTRLYSLFTPDSVLSAYIFKPQRREVAVPLPKFPRKASDFES
jgi:hypothetical protein